MSIIVNTWPNVLPSKVRPNFDAVGWPVPPLSSDSICHRILNRSPINGLRLSVPRNWPFVRLTQAGHGVSHHASTRFMIDCVADFGLCFILTKS